MSKHDIPFREIPEEFREETFAREMYRRGFADAQGGEEPMPDDELEKYAEMQGYIVTKAYDAGYKKGAPIQLEVSEESAEELAKRIENLDEKNGE